MTSTRKEHIKQLKGPDQFQVRMMRYMDWAVRNTRLIVYFVAPVALVIVGVFVFQYMQGRSKNSRLEELGKIEVVYDAEARKAGDARQALQKQMEAIETKIAAAKTPATPAKDSKPQTVKSATDKATAPATAAAAPDPKLTAEKDVLKKQIDAIKPDHAESATKFMAFYKKYDTQPEGWLAGMTAARVAIDQEKYGDARALFDEIVSKSQNNTFYQIQARLALAGLLEEQGDFDKALAQTDALDKLVTDDVKPKVALARGRMQLLKKSNAEAKATLNALIEKNATSPEAQKARSLLSLIGG